MPQPVLPEAARQMSAQAEINLGDKSDRLPFETFSTVYYEGWGEDDIIRGRLEEVDRDTWIETVGGNLFTFEEVSETADEVVLYDASRDRTVTIDSFSHMIVSAGDSEQHFGVIDVEHAFWV